MDIPPRQEFRPDRGFGDRKYLKFGQAASFAQPSNAVGPPTDARRMAIRPSDGLSWAALETVAGTARLPTQHIYPNKARNDVAGMLEGIRVLDFGRYIAGPYAATMLADLAPM